MAEKVLMKGNEAIAYAAINCGADTAARPAARRS